MSERRSPFLHGCLGRHCRGTAINLPSLQTPCAAVPLGSVPGARFRTAVGREALCAVWVFFVGEVTMLVLVKLALSLVPCAKEGCTRRATNVSAMRPSRMIKIPERGTRRTVTAFCLKASPRSWCDKGSCKLAIRAAFAAMDLTRKSLAKLPIPGYLIGLDD
jgi:hypothetical protein